MKNATRSTPDLTGVQKEIRGQLEPNRSDVGFYSNLFGLVKKKKKIKIDIYFGFLNFQFG